MSLGNVEERIRKMKDAIKYEAQQRAQNIVDKAKDDADIERNKILTLEKDKLEIEYSQKFKSEGVRAKMYVWCYLDKSQDWLIRRDSESSMLLTS